MWSRIGIDKEDISYIKQRKNRLLNGSKREKYEKIYRKISYYLLDVFIILKNCE